MKPIVITITSNKGGVGKTTTAAALCDIYRKKYPVLLIDTDPQCNCAAKFGFEVPVDRGRLGDMLIDMVQDHLKHKPFEEYIESSQQYKNLDVLYGGKMIRQAAYDYMFSFSASAALKSFKRIIQAAAETGKYRIIIIDTPPTYGNETDAIFNATDYLLIPTLAEGDSVEGADFALQKAANAREDNPNLKIAGIFLNRIYDNDSATHKVEPFLREAWKDKVLKTRIPDNRAAISDAINESEPVTTRKPVSKASKAFTSLAKEVENIVDL